MLLRSLSIPEGELNTTFHGFNQRAIPPTFTRAITWASGSKVGTVGWAVRRDISSTCPRDWATSGRRDGATLRSHIQFVPNHHVSRIALLTMVLTWRVQDIKRKRRWQWPGDDVRGNAARYCIAARSAVLTPPSLSTWERGRLQREVSDCKKHSCS